VIESRLPIEHDEDDHAMGKKEKHQAELIDLFDEWRETGRTEQIISYVVSHSALPGKRANLELAGAFGEIVARYSQREDQKLWELLTKMTGVSADEAPVNDPREFIPFCGAIGVGALGASSPSRFDAALLALKALANDPRWRMREAVRFGLQRLLFARAQDTLQALDGWVADGTPLELRAAAATVAEPGRLKETEIATAALQLHRKVFDRVLTTQERRSEDFRTLREALGYTLSVVVQALPQEGFRLLTRLIQPHDPDLIWIVKQNLRKNRLVENFPEQVASTRRLLNS
jgi:hypothetical protein